MFTPQNRIIIVDNIEEHLIKLSKVFTYSGIACRTILYDHAYSTPLTGIRIAFFDINISQKSIDLRADEFDYKTDRNISTAFNDLAIALQSVIAPDNGPYALVFWSQNIKLKDNFIEYIRDTKRGLGICLHLY